MPRGKTETPKGKSEGSSGSAKDSKGLIGSSNALEAARAYLTKKKGKEFTETRVALDPDSLREPLPHISSGSDVIDFLIGGSPNKFGVAPCPGFPRGRVTQVWGHESSGKTTLALEAAAEVCAAGGSVLYIDWENDIVPIYAYALGVPITDPSKFELLQPDTLEDGIKFAMTYAAAGVDLIVFDSVGAGVPRRLVDRDAIDTAEQAKIGEPQAIWSQELPNLKRLIAKTGTAVIGISQTRATMQTQGKATKPMGGNAWKFYSSVRLELRRVTNETKNEHNVLTHKSESRVFGGIIKITAVKCKMSSSQGREEIFYIRWGEGIDNVRTMMEIASAHGILQKSGSWISWADCPGGPEKHQGTEKFRDYLIANPAKYDVLRERVMPLLGQGAAAHFVDEMDDDDPEAEAVDDVDDVLSDAGIDID